MSASKDKKIRKDILAPVGSNEKARKSKVRKNILTAVAIVLVVVLSIGSVVIFKGPYFRTHSVAVTTGSHELSPAMVRYFYSDTFNEMYQNYGSIFSQMFTDTTNIQDQVYDESTGSTWGDAIMEQTIEKIRTTYAIYDKAMAEGYTLSEEGESSISTNVSYIGLYAQMYGMNSDAYIRNLYGSGSKLKTYEDYLRITTTVSYYEKSVNDAFTYSQDQLNSAYAESPSSYDVYSYHSYFVSGQTDSTDDAEKTAALDKAKESADAMAEASKGSLTEFLNQCNTLSGTDNYTSGTQSLRTNVKASSMTDSTKEWLTDSSRKEGDTTAVPYETYGYYVLYYVGKSDNNYDALKANIIKISASTTGTDGTTTTDWDGAKTKLDQVQSDFAAADDAATALKTLASTYSSDTNTSSTSGLNEYIYHNQFETVVNDWLFGSTHQEGETTTLQGTDAYYFIYFDGVSGNYRDYLVAKALRSTDYTNWLTAAIADATVTQNDFGMKHVNRELHISSSSTSSY